MFGFGTYGGVPYGASGIPSGAGSALDVETMLADSTPKVYTAEVKVWSLAGDVESTLYFATSEWTTEPTDTPASQPFVGILQTALAFERSILGSDKIGVFATGDGQLVIANADGAYDTIVDTYAVDGREVTVRIGRKADPYTDHYVIFRGIASGWFANLDTVTITLRDFGYRLAVPAQSAVYAGTGGAEGGSDLTGKRLPRTYGLVLGAPPVLVNESLLIYQVSDTTASGIVSVYDRGVLLTTGGVYADYAALAAAVVAPGTFAYCLAGTALYRLGAAPSGVVFQSVFELIPKTTSTSIHALLLASTVLTTDDMDEGSFDAVEAAQPAWIGYYLAPDEAVSVADLIARLMDGIGGWGGFNRAGKFELRIFNAPSGSPVAYYNHDEGDIFSLDRDRPPSPPTWRWRVPWSRAWTVFTDFAGAVPDAIRTLYSQPYRLAIAEDAAILTDHPLAQDPTPVEAYFSSEADAQAEADRLLALYAETRWLYRMTVSRRGLRQKLGDEIQVTHPRFGLDAGRLMTIVRIAENITFSEGGDLVDTVEIVAFG